MMARALASDRISRLAALALTGIVALGLYLFLLAPLYLRYAIARDGLLTQRELLGRLALADAASPTASGAAASDAGTGLYLEGESDAVMVSSLQAALQSTGTSSGWRLLSTRVLPPRKEGPLRLIGIEGRLSTTLAGLQRTLLALDAARPVVVVTSLQVTPVASVAPQGENTASREDLAVRLELYGAAGVAVAGPSNAKR
jgi:Type II secretion system (T2SS), protein M subtype b